MAGQQAQITKEEAIMKSVFSLLAAGTLLCLLTNTALAVDNSTNSEAARQDHSLLSIWDRPAFSPAPSTGLVPWLDSRPAKGQRVDFLLRPDLQKFGPLLAQKGSRPASSAAAPLQVD
jgi:hypothetical protein